MTEQKAGVSAVSLVETWILNITEDFKQGINTVRRPQSYVAFYAASTTRRALLLCPVGMDGERTFVGSASEQVRDEFAAMREIWLKENKQAGTQATSVEISKVSALAKALSAEFGGEGDVVESAQ